MQGFVRPLATESTESQTEQDSIRAVTTRSQTAGDNDQSIQGSSSDTRGPLNQWLTDQDLARAQKLQSKDAELAPISTALAKGERPPHSEVVALSPAVRYYWSIWGSLSLRNECRYRTFNRKDATGCHLQFIVPKMLKNEILGQVHNSLISGH